jgi:hypothetical protein
MAKSINKKMMLGHRRSAKSIRKSEKLVKQNQEVIAILKNKN